MHTMAHDLLTETQRALAQMVQERDAMAAKYAQLLKVTDEMREEEELSHTLIGRQGDLLRGVVNALKGEPPELTSWSHHDAPELAAAAVKRIAELRKQNQWLHEIAKLILEDFNKEAWEEANAYVKNLPSPGAYHR